MKQLEAKKINWPDGEAYYIERDKWCPLMFFTKQEFLEQYSVDLLNILDKEWTYKSPYIDKNQLELDFN